MSVIKYDMIPDGQFYCCLTTLSTICQL